jgi:tetratricopeptide (TPR) repeat protein
VSAGARHSPADGLQSYQAARTLLFLALILRDRGDRDQAAELTLQVNAIYDHLPDTPPAELARARYNLGWAFIDQLHFAEAESAFRRGVELSEKADERDYAVRGYVIHLALWLVSACVVGFFALLALAGIVHLGEH